MYNQVYYGRKSAIFWLSFFGIFMVIFTFLDLPIAKAIFNYNRGYGEIFKLVGLLPTCMCGIFYAISNLATRKIARRKVISAILSYLSLLLFIGFTLISVYELERKYFIHTIVFCVFFIFLSIYFNIRLCKKANLYNMRKVMIIALVSVLVAVAGQTLIKHLFNRPRFITLTDPDIQYRPWFVHYPFTFDSSFPSGHAAQAALCFLLMYFKRFIPAMRKKSWDIAICIFASFITISTMLARMFLGAHYATDVWAGSFLTLITISLMNQYVERSYMLPKYRFSIIREKIERLKTENCIEEFDSSYDGMLDMLKGAESLTQKDRVVLTILYIKEKVDVILRSGRITSKEKSQLGIVRNYCIKFVHELMLENYDYIYTPGEQGLNENET